MEIWSGPANKYLGCVTITTSHWQPLYSRPLSSCWMSLLFSLAGYEWPQFEWYVNSLQQKHQHVPWNICNKFPYIYALIFSVFGILVQGKVFFSSYEVIDRLNVVDLGRLTFTSYLSYVYYVKDILEKCISLTINISLNILYKNYFFFLE